MLHRPGTGAAAPHALDRPRAAVRRRAMGRPRARGARRVRRGVGDARRRDRLPRRPARRRARATRGARGAGAEPRTRRCSGRPSDPRCASGSLALPSAELAEHLIAGRDVRRAAVHERQHRGAHGSRVRRGAAAEHAVHARHVGVDLRRRLGQHHGDAGAHPRIAAPVGRLPPSPDVHRAPRSTSGATTSRRRCSSKAATRLVIGNGAVLVGMGERTHPAAVEILGQAAVRRRRGDAR